MAIAAQKFTDFCSDWTAREGGYNLGSLVTATVATSDNLNKHIAVLDAYKDWLIWIRDESASGTVDPATQLTTVVTKVWAVVAAAKDVDLTVS